MINLPEMPKRIERLPRDDRGYPVPAFVEWLLDGKPAVRGGGARPDFRIANADFRARAFRHGYCWICGDRLGVHKVYAIGPMCVINRTTSEPASHRECAEFAASACPFLVRPRQKRNAKDLDEAAGSPGGIMLDRNPGCLCLYEALWVSRFDDGRGGWLIQLGPPTKVDWWAEGRRATRAEIQASIDGGFPLLLDMAMKEGQDAVDELGRLTFNALKLLPAA